MYRLLAVLLVLLLAGCASAPPSPVDAQARHANRFFQQGRFESAADLYLALAQHAKGEKRNLYRLMAADSLLQAGEEDKGKALLERLDPKVFKGQALLRYQLLRARLALKRKDAAAAISLLQPVLKQGEEDLPRRALGLLAQAHDLQGDSLAKLRDLLQLDPLLKGQDQRLRTQLEILSLMTRIPATDLEKNLPDDATTLGWRELAGLAARFARQPEQLQQPFQEWKKRHPSHPALPDLLAHWFEQQRQLAPEQVARLAVLLPQSGRFKKAAAALRSGLLAAWYDDPADTRPVLEFHDSSDPDQIWPLINQLARQGTQMVLGPLIKNNVLQLARAGKLPLTVLALNHVSTDTAPPESLYQYALSPEEEARQAALWAASMGLGRPGILYPDNASGKRVARAFQSAWLTLGRGDLRAQPYHSDKRDYSPVVARLLGVASLEAAHERLEKKEGKRLPFNPKLPVDFVYIIGRKSDVLQLRPMVQFHHGTHLPVLAQSRAWGGGLTHQEALDLRGVMVPEIPWLVESDDQSNLPLSSQQAKELFPRQFHHYARLIAMGMDAYRLTHELNRLATSRSEEMIGATGRLSLDERGVIHRRLTWVSLGEPVAVLGPTPQPDEIDPDNWLPAGGSDTNTTDEAAPPPSSSAR